MTNSTLRTDLFSISLLKTPWSDTHPAESLSRRSLNSLQHLHSIIPVYLLKRGTTWNQLKYLKPPETSHIIFLLKISYFQVKFVLILHPKVFLRQIWSQKLKFSKLTKIWYRDTLLYPHVEFNVYFSKIFVTHFFLDIAIYLLQF